MLVLDTDVLTLIQRRSGEDYRKLVDRIESSGEEVYVAMVSLEEQMRGWLAFCARAKSPDQEVVAYSKLHGLIDDFRGRGLLDYDRATADHFQRLKKARIRIGTMDLKIAATALAYGATLISRNLSDFRKVPDLRVEDWTT